jgi:peroxiredoxin family protein
VLIYLRAELLEGATEIVSYILAAIGLVLLYEALRAFIKEKIVRHFSRSAIRYINENRIKLDRFKFMNKFIIKKELMNNIEIHEAVIEHARERGISIRFCWCRKASSIMSFLFLKKEHFCIENMNWSVR